MTECELIGVGKFIFLLVMVTGVGGGVYCMISWFIKNRAEQVVGRRLRGHESDILAHIAFDNTGVVPTQDGLVSYIDRRIAKNVREIIDTGNISFNTNNKKGA